MRLASEERDDSASAELDRDRSGQATPTGKAGVSDGNIPGGRPTPTAAELDSVPPAKNAGAPDAERVPGGNSADAGATERAAPAKGDGKSEDARYRRGDFTDKEAAESSGMGRKLGLAVRAATGNRRALFVLAGTGGIIGLIMALFIFMLPYKIIQIEKTIVGHYDAPMEHAINHRVGNGWALARNGKGDVTGFQRQRTGKPLQDMYANYHMKRAMSDLGLDASFDNKGNLLSVRDYQGKAVDLSEASLKDKRSAIRGLYRERYPEMGFFRVSASTRRIDGALGIKRKFLENKREKISNKEADLKSGLADKVKSVFSANGTADEEGERAKVTDEASDEESNIKGTSVKAAAAGLGGAKFAIEACSFKKVADDTRTSIILIRSANQMKFAFVALSTASQLQRGDLHPAQFSAFMTQFQGFEKSPLWQRITTNKKVPVDKDNLSLDHGFANTFSRKVDGISGANTVCDVANHKGATALITLGDIVVTFTSALDDGVSTAAVEAASQGAKSAITGAVQGAILGKGLEYGLKEITDSATESPIDDKSTGADRVDVTVAGYDNYANTTARAVGGERVTGAQRASMDQEIALEDKQDAQQHSLAYRLFSTDYDNSLASQFFTKAPVMPTEIASAFSSALNSVFSPGSPAQLATIGGFFHSAVRDAGAYTTASEEEDSTGVDVPQFRVTDELMDKYPDTSENEDWVIGYLADQKPSGLKNSSDSAQTLSDDGADENGELTGKNDDHDDDYHKFVKKCATSFKADDYLGGDCAKTGEPWDRFRVYRFETAGTGNYVHSWNNDDNDQNDPDGAGGSSSASSATAAVGDAATTDDAAVTGDAKELAQKLLDLAKSGKIKLTILNQNDTSDRSTPELQLEDTAAGKAVHTTTTCSGRGAVPPNNTVALDPTLLKFLVALAGKSSYSINALAGQCHGEPSSNHYKGKAVDFGCPYDATEATEVGKQYGISDGTGEYCSNTAHFHYSIGGH